jgi:hypothetical protein
MSDVFPRIARNPMTGEAVNLLAKVVPHFKPGKEMRDRINAARTQHQGIITLKPQHLSGRF